MSSGTPMQEAHEQYLPSDPTSASSSQMLMDDGTNCTDQQHQQQAIIQPLSHMSSLDSAPSASPGLNNQPSISRQNQV